MIDFTPEQRATIVRAVRIVRRALAGKPVNPSRFFIEFTRAGGLLAPGRELTVNEHRRIYLVVLAFLAGGAKSLHDDELFSIALREIGRASNESCWIVAGELDDVVAMRLVIDGTQAELSGVDVVTSDTEGLGPGLYSIRSVVVLPPRCDGAYFEPVFADEL